MLVDIDSIFYPDLRVNSSLSVSDTVLDAGNEKFGWAVRLDEDATVSKVGFRVGTVTTGATVDVRLETIGADGLPTGTLFGTNTNGSQVIADTDDNTFFLTSLTSSASLSSGDQVAIVIVNPSVSPGTFGVSRSLIGFISNYSLMPYGLADLGGGWAQSEIANELLLVALEKSGGGYCRLAGAMGASSAGSTVSLKDDVSPDEAGNRFTVPFRCRCVGIWNYAFLPAGADYQVKLYDGSDNLLASSAVVDGDVPVNSLTRTLSTGFTSPTVLERNTLYRFTVRSQTVSAAITVRSVAANTNALLGSFPGGASMYRTQRSNNGAWTDTDNERIVAGLILNQISGADSGRLVL